MMDPADHLAILALYAEYNRTIDAGDAASWARTFHEAGVFHHPSRAFDGRVQLEAFVAGRVERLATHDVVHQRHWNDEIAVVGSDDRATGRCLLLIAGVDRSTLKPVVVAMGSYVDELVKVGNRWLFQQRTLRVS